MKLAEKEKVNKKSIEKLINYEIPMMDFPKNVEPLGTIKKGQLIS